MEMDRSRSYDILSRTVPQNLKHKNKYITIFLHRKVGQIILKLDRLSGVGFLYNLNIRSGVCR